MKSFKSIVFVAFVSGLLLLTSCGEDDPTPALEATLVENLGADPASGFDAGTGAPIGYTGKYKFFSFATGETVANADSASSNWDIGFRGTGIIINSGTSGPGTAAARVVEGIFDELTTAPDAGYLQDNKNTPAYAIPTGSGNGWYSYNNATQIISPIAGRVIVVKTSDEKYAKLEILSYYKDAPAEPNSMSDMPRYYTFRYIYQPDGSKRFK
jgi:HmuY protein